VKVKIDRKFGPVATKNLHTDESDSNLAASGVEAEIARCTDWLERALRMRMTNYRLFERFFEGTA
jgi:hypothetical protein